MRAGRTLFLVLLGVLASHCMRAVIRRIRLLEESIRDQVLGVVAVTLVFSCICSVAESTFIHATGTTVPAEERLGFALLNLRIAFNAFVSLFLWNTIYVLLHYIGKARRQETDKLRLQNTVKELELRRIKSQINPHFIFNSLNSIRALVDEDPDRAREAVTALGNILRISLQSGQRETVQLQRELGIVRDYLALQHIRFEDRLKVEYVIDPATLNLPVPVMMLQTLVENAVKHGIGRRVNGGLVRILSRMRGDRFELVVQNTGHLNRTGRHSGFGCSSTMERLSILYGNDASFSIEEKSEGLVEALVVMPVAQTRFAIDESPAALSRGAA